MKIEVRYYQYNQGSEIRFNWEGVHNALQLAPQIKPEFEFVEVTPLSIFYPDTYDWASISGSDEYFKALLKDFSELPQTTILGAFRDQISKFVTLIELSNFARRIFEPTVDYNQLVAGITVAPTAPPVPVEASYNGALDLGQLNLDEIFSVAQDHSQPAPTAASFPAPSINNEPKTIEDFFSTFILPESQGNVVKIDTERLAALKKRNKGFEEWLPLLRATINKKNDFIESIPPCFSSHEKEIFMQARQRALWTSNGRNNAPISPARAKQIVMDLETTLYDTNEDVSDETRTVDMLLSKLQNEKEGLQSLRKNNRKYMQWMPALRGISKFDFEEKLTSYDFTPDEITLLKLAQERALATVSRRKRKAATRRLNLLGLSAASDGFFMESPAAPALDVRYIDTVIEENEIDQQVNADSMDVDPKAAQVSSSLTQDKKTIDAFLKTFILPTQKINQDRLEKLNKSNKEFQEWFNVLHSTMPSILKRRASALNFEPDQIEIFIKARKRISLDHRKRPLLEHQEEMEASSAVVTQIIEVDKFLQILKNDETRFEFLEARNLGFMKYMPAVCSIRPLAFAAKLDSYEFTPEQKQILFLVRERALDSARKRRSRAAPNVPEEKSTGSDESANFSNGGRSSVRFFRSPSNSSGAEHLLPNIESPGCS